MVYRRDGDDNVIVEYGDPVLDLGLRMRVHALQEALAAEGLAGVIDLTPGIRSLQVHTDAARLPARSLLPLLQRVEDALPPGARAARAVAHRAAAAVVGRPGDPARHRAVHARRPLRRAVDPVEHRVHPAGQRAGDARGRAATSSSPRGTWCSGSATCTWARRWPRRSTRGTGWSPPSTTRRGPGRRRTPSASAARTCASTAWRDPAATSSSGGRPRCGTGSAAPGCSRSSRGRCASSTRSSGTRSAPRSCSTCAPRPRPGAGTWT